MNSQSLVRASLAAALLLSLSAPAFAEASIQSSKNLCKAAAKEKAATSVKVFDQDTKIAGSKITFTMKVTGADGAKTTVECAVDRVSSTVASYEAKQ